jgi:MFS family permease
MLATAAAAHGAVLACIYPYLSLIAVQNVGLSEPMLALLLGLASISVAGSSVLFGLIADQNGKRRQIALVTVGLTVLGCALMLTNPGPLTLFLAHGLLLPIGTSIFGQIFALNNLAAQAYPTQREGLQSTLRAGISAVFLFTLIFWTWGLGPGGFGVMSVYVTALIASLILAVLIWHGWPHAGRTQWQDRPSGLNLAQALVELLHPSVAFRLLCLGAIGGLPMLYIVLTPLLFAQESARQMSDVALLVGLVAGFEVPFMLALPRLVRHVSRQRLIAAGAVIYALFVLLLALFPGGNLLWALPFLAGLGAAPILTLPIGYWQDLMVGRPGTASALFALQKLAGDLLCAATFGLGTYLGGYTVAALLGGALATTGAVGLLLIDQARPSKMNCPPVS